MITITEFKKEHLGGICEVENKSFSIPWSRKAFESELENENAVYRVALSGDKVIGYAGLWKVIDEGDITNIAVLPEFRRMGAASSLMEALIDFCKSAGLIKLTLEVRRSNSAAIQLYKKCGFKETGFRKQYYADNREDALIMALDITS